MSQRAGTLTGALADSSLLPAPRPSLAAGASSPGGGSPRHPSPVPLDLGSPNYVVLPLLRLTSGAAEGDGGGPPEKTALTTDELAAAGLLLPVVLSFEQHPPEQQDFTAGAELLAHATARRRSLEQHRRCLEAPHEWGLAVGALALQAHMHGWQDALQCLMSYSAPGMEVAALVAAATGPLPPPRGGGTAGAAAAAAAQRAAAAASTHQPAASASLGRAPSLAAPDPPQAAVARLPARPNSRPR